ncbi:hypothetical protein FRC01_000534 [Tulasnella sp. 417]|nr:hypothetical protein FRC01_000534 [Tulasnella sp. 417]
MNDERPWSRRNRFPPAKQRMVDPRAWTTDDESSPYPAAEELPTFPIPTPSSSGASTNADDALLPLITQPADPVAAAIARRQNTVVTVTSTQFSGTIDSGPSSQKDDGVPIVTIAVSAGVGVFLAGSARPSHKNQTSTSSVAPLKGATPPRPPGQQRRSREKQPGIDRSAPPSHTRSASGGPQGGQQQQRRPGQPAVPPPAVTTTSPPNSKRRSPPGAGTPTSPSGRTSFSDSATLNNTSSSTSSPPSTVGSEESSTPRKGGRGSGGKSDYTPQKPSPLSVGAERAKPKEKPKEKSKVNEWGTGFPVSNASSSAPSSPTRSSSSGHGHQSWEQPGPPPPVPPVPSLSVTSSGGRQSANLLALPEPAAHYQSRRDRISVLSDSSYYALDPDEEYGPQDVFMGVALGGDEPSPIPEEYFSPNWDDDEDDYGKGKMERQQDGYLSNRLSDAQVDGYYYQQQSYSRPASQYQSQGGPTYPPRLLKAVLNYHFNRGIGGKDTVVDIGCGTGQVTQTLSPYFNRVIGADPSEGMIETARKKHASNERKMEFIVASGEEVDQQVEKDSVDLITAGQAAHWFDYQRLWPSLARMLKPGGTVALWGYSEFRIANHPELSPLITQYSLGSDSLGPYWEPGRKILDNHYRDIAFPTAPEWDFDSARRIYFSGELVPELQVVPACGLPAEDESQIFPDVPEIRTGAIMGKTMPWDGAKSWLRTWSSLHTYQQQHPEDKERTGAGEHGDIVDRFVEVLKDKLGTETVDIQWPVSLLMIKKKSA